MKGKKPQKQLLQFVMLSLLSVVSVLVMANESFAALQCYSCHGQTNDIRPLDTAPGSASSVRDSATGAVKGSHAKHLAATTNPANCNVCHNTQMSAPGHRDGRIELAATLSYNKGAGNITFTNQTTVPVLGTCSVACHNATSTTVGVTTPTWGATANCASCHAEVPGSSHTQHVTSTLYKKATCADCHAGTTQNVTAGAGHLDGDVDVTGYTAQNKVKGSAVSTCSTTYCHSSGQSANGLSATPVYATVTWGGTAACGSCHATTTMTTGSHFAHLGIDTNCGNCHTGSAAASYNSTAHVDGNINVAAGIGYTAAATRGDGYGTCSAASCHAIYTDVAPAVTPIWGGNSDCDSCHAGTPVTGAHSKHYAVAAIGFTCSKCHTSSGAVTHANGSVNVIGSLGTLIADPVAKHASTNYTATCTTTCHSAYTGSVSTPAWGATAGCTSCHDSSNTGAHSAHIAAAVACGTCHAGATTTNGGSNHANGVINVTQIAGGTTPKHAAATYTATCTTTCHSPYTTAVATPAWGATATCTTCHDSSNTGAHSKHNAAAVVASCSTCHATGTAHINGSVDVLQVSGGTVAKHLSGNANYAATCNTACHDPYTAGTAGAGKTTPAWGATATCATCHNGAGAFVGVAGPATGSHAKHMQHGIFVKCDDCHTGASSTVSGAGHLDGNIDVTGYSVPNKAKGSAVGTCTANCHNGPAGQFTAPAATWGTTLDCTGCHGNPPLNSNHTGVLVNTCNSCHSNVNPGASTFVDVTLHMNKIVEGGKCDACHGYPPVQSMAGFGTNANYSSAKLQNYSGGGGAHSVAGHLALTLKASNGGSFAGCVTCHPSGATHNEGAGVFQTAKVQVTVDTQFKFDKNLPIVYNKVSGPKSTGTCSNVSCHFKPTPIWSAETYTQGH